jgi:hypothetical protein
MPYSLSSSTWFSPILNGGHPIGVTLWWDPHTKQVENNDIDEIIRRPVEAALSTGLG